MTSNVRPTITPQTHDQMLQMRDRLLKKLDRMGKRRHLHDDWNERELQALSDASGVPLDAVRRVETCAVGHVDYASKLCWYVTELAFGVSPLQQAR
jgi:hypothetical protein